MNYYERAQELNEETIANRRYFHTNAEVGLDMPKAKAYVMKKLTEYGLEPKECGYGAVSYTHLDRKCSKIQSGAFRTKETSIYGNSTDSHARELYCHV